MWYGREEEWRRERLGVWYGKRRNGGGGEYGMEEGRNGGGGGGGGGGGECGMLPNSKVW